MFYINKLLYLSLNKSFIMSLIKLKFPIFKGKSRTPDKTENDNFYFDATENFTEVERKSVSYWRFIAILDDNCVRSNFNSLQYYRIKGERGLIKSK